MDFLFVAIILVGVLIVKAVLSGKENEIRAKRAKRRMESIIQDAQLNGKEDDPVQAGNGHHKVTKPPPLPPKED